MLLTEADRRTEQLRYAMTPAEVIAAQLWIWKREASLRKPGGSRRRTDRGGRVKMPLKAWRERAGLSLTELGQQMRTGAAAAVSIDTLRALENGSATPAVRRQYLGRIAAVLQVPETAILITAVTELSR